MDEIERTKFWIRQFIIANTLHEKVHLPDDEFDWLIARWTKNDVDQAEYKILWNQVEAEMRGANNVR